MPTTHEAPAPAMTPSKTVFVCQECSAQSPKWLGRCNECGVWNSLVEERAIVKTGLRTSSNPRVRLS